MPIQVILAIRLLAMTDELGVDQQHTAMNRVKDPSGETLSEVTGEFTIGGAEAVRPDWLTGIILPTAVQFEAKAEGAYMIEHDVDGVSESLPIHVVHGPRPGVDFPDEPPSR